jgi:hypothetical protein
MKQAQTIFRWLVAALLLTSSLSSARAEDKPSVIRIAFPGVGVGNPPTSAATARPSLICAACSKRSSKKTASR